jgi:hypothetical protein
MQKSNGLRVIAVGGWLAPSRPDGFCGRYGYSGKIDCRYPIIDRVRPGEQGCCSEGKNGVYKGLSTL